MNWRQHAACARMDPDLFFPVGSSGPGALQRERAKAVCRTCPVIQECLDWALRAGETSGVWGGTCENERRELARRAERTRRYADR
ncbi:WhiB family transcriptional regulator [Streptomyces albiaxialis]|uniref:Transcriptional regulator WhiB n=1 Tax=Streptomyces albiaxialis TaxID=329523 RepID=A0ABN2W0G4_9ACTN